MHACARLHAWWRSHVLSLASSLAILLLVLFLHMKMLKSLRSIHMPHSAWSSRQRCRSFSAPLIEHTTAMQSWSESSCEVPHFHPQSVSEGRIVGAQAEKSVAKFEETGGVLGDLGMALIRLGKFEDEDGTACGAYSASASASRSIAADTRRIGKVLGLSIRSPADHRA